MTKSAMATPGRVDLAVSTVKMEGSYRSRKATCDVFSSDMAVKRGGTATHGVIEGHAVDHHEVLQVVFVRRVVPVPGDHIERRKILHAEKKTNKDECGQATNTKDFKLSFLRGKTNNE